MITDLNVAQLLNGRTRRALHTTRYSSYVVHHRESVAEHTFCTVLYTYIISQHLRQHGFVVNAELALSKALCHDLEEPSGVGDILRQVKHSSLAMSTMLQELGLKYVTKTATDLSTPIIVEHWVRAKDETIEGNVVRLADALSVVSFLVEEHGMGNRLLEEVVTDVRVFLKSVEQVMHPVMAELMSRVRQYFDQVIGGA